MAWVCCATQCIDVPRRAGERPLCKQIPSLHCAIMNNRKM